MKQFAFLFLCLFVTYSTLADDKNGISLSEAIHKYENLQIIPILANKSLLSKYSDFDKYLTIEEAIQDKKIKITEIGGTGRANSMRAINFEAHPSIEPRPNPVEPTVQDTISRIDINVIAQDRIPQQQFQSSGTVNTLQIENLSNDTIYLMAGDLVTGGKQDRVIAKDLIIPPGTETIKASVFCVEKGRWSYGDTTGEFKSYKKAVSNVVRGSVQQDGEQSKVWSKVSEVQLANSVSSSTGAYQSIHSNKEYLEKQKKYLDAFLGLTAEYDNIVGVIAITGDSIIACDIFTSHGLFKKKYESLLNSYATDAISFGKKVGISDGKTQEYFEEVRADIFNKADSKNIRFYHTKRLIHYTRF